VQNWKRTTGTALLAVIMASVPLLTTSPVLADSQSSANPPIMVPIMLRIVTGIMTHVDVEGGYYAVDGWMLKGDETVFKQYLGKEVQVGGTPDSGISVQMVKSLIVTEINGSKVNAGNGSDVPIILEQTNQDVPANLPNPSVILVNGRDVSFDQRPVVVDGTLMVPLRALTEAAGAVVTWEEETHSINVNLSDRTVILQIGQSEAEVNMRGVMYIRRNMIGMAKAPVIIGNRTMISADALSSILGLKARGTGATLDLVNVAP
jgi:hypothetical protein